MGSLSLTPTYENFTGFLVLAFVIKVGVFVIVLLYLKKYCLIVFLVSEVSSIEIINVSGFKNHIQHLLIYNKAVLILINVGIINQICKIIALYVIATLHLENVTLHRR